MTWIGLEAITICKTRTRGNMMSYTHSSLEWPGGIGSAEEIQPGKGVVGHGAA